MPRPGRKAPKKRCLLVLTILAAAAPVFALDGSAPRPIGFRVIERVDTSRPSKAFPAGRPIQISFWYPAASASPEISYRDYFFLAARETSFDEVNRQAAEHEALGRYQAFLSSVGVKPEETEALLNVKMRASRGADPAGGRFPLVLIAAGNEQSAHDQAFLAEYLAARGYAVATVPSQSRIGERMTSEQDIPSQTRAQAADLAVALREVRLEPQVRAGRYGVVAYSFGARSALLLAMEDPDLTALVSLDGGIGSRTGKGQLEKAKGFRKERATAPLLHLYEEVDRNMIPDFDLLRSLDHCQRWLVRVDGMSHAHFSSVGVQVGTVPSLARATSADARTARAWTAVASATASFLDRFVGDAGVSKRSPAAWAPPASSLLHPTSLEAAPAPSPIPAPGKKK